MIITTKRTVPYVLRRERELPREQQTTFHLRALTNSQRFSLLDMNTVQGGSASLRGGTMAQTALRIGLAGWDNLADENGSQVAYAATPGKTLIHGVTADLPATEDTINRLPWEAAEELVDAIMNGMTLDQVDAKKSS